MYANKYWNFGDAVYWARYVYKYEARTAFRKCCFECYHDSTCDYFVDAHSHCFYGRFSYTGTQLGGWTDRTTVYVKNGTIQILSFL